MLKHTWEQGIFLDMGVNKNLTADRILFLYDSQACVYPAEPLDDLIDYSIYKNFAFYKDIRSGAKPYVIERDVEDLFGSDKRYISFWAPLKNRSGTKLGAIGL